MIALSEAKDRPNGALENMLPRDAGVQPRLAPHSFTPRHYRAG